jgi:hypothetical protein
MKIRFPLSPKAVFVILAMASEIGFAAPSTEELLVAVPPAIIGPYGGDPINDFTRWHLHALSGVGSERRSISFRAVFTQATSSTPNDFLTSEGYFIYDPDLQLFSPTAKVVETTRPDELPGGTWSFSYVRREENFGTPTFAIRVAYWTWTEDEPIDPPVIVTNKTAPLALVMNRSALRAIRGKNPRKALRILVRQQGLLMGAE